MMRLLLALLLACLPLAALAEGARAFVFGHSLVNHPDGGPETSVPTWLAQMAEAGGHDLALDGAWGFLPDHAKNLPPEAQWSFPGVARAWDPEATAFRMAGFDTIVLAPTNFIQFEAPDAPHPAMEGASALDLSARVLDWAANQMPEAAAPRLLVYESWADMGDVAGFPPDPPGLARWHAWNRGGFHDWHVRLADLLAERLGRPVGLIPVGRVLSALEAEGGPLAAVPPEALWSDDAPHGTPTTYLLAALVTYAVLTGEEPPPIDLPASIDPVLRGAYPQVAAAVAEATGARRLAVDVVPENPGLGLNLAGVSDWSTEHPFLDAMRSARPWIGHEPGAWGAWDAHRLRAGGYLSPEGWPLAIPPGVDRLEALVLTDQPEGARHLAGPWVLRWEGEGTVEVLGLAREAQATGERRLRFLYEPGPGSVAVAVTAIDPADPVRDVTLVREEDLALHEGGALFNPDFLARVRGARSFRFMDWMATNGSDQVAWEDRPRMTDATWAWRGVPVEAMVRLADEAGADPWFTLPHGADDAYVRAFASFVRDNLDPRLRVHAEWSNEVWNFIFPQAAWARERAEALWGEDAPDDAWMQIAGVRAAEVADVWSEVFEGQEDRLVRVVGVHTGWPGLEEALLDAPLAVAEGVPPPFESFDAYAVTGYVGHDAQALDWPALLGSGGAEAALTALARGDARELADDLWPHHARAAAARGLRLVAYEGGPHLVAPEAGEAAWAAIAAWSYGPEAAAIHDDLADAWAEAGGTLFAAFVDVAPPSRWGAWGGLRHLDDQNPRWDALARWNARGAPWEARDSAAFADGVLAQGTEGPDRLEGTAEEDDLLGFSGDDVLASGGGSDRLHGGEGHDRALLPGAEGEWQRSEDGAAVLMSRAGVTVRLTAVEEVGFEGGGVPAPGP